MAENNLSSVALETFFLNKAVADWLMGWESDREAVEVACRSGVGGGGAKLSREISMHTKQAQRLAG